MKTVIEMADEVFDRMLPDGHCREPYWTATEDELKRFAELVRADECEACADLCYQLVDNSRETRFATAIRARGNT